MLDTVVIFGDDVCCSVFSDGDQKKQFVIVNSLLGRGKQALLPQHDDFLTLARLFNEFFITKIDNIRHEFPILEQNLPMPFSINFNVILDLNLVSSLTYFKHTTVDEVNVLLSKMNKTTCMFDPFPTRFLLNYSHLFINVIVRIINLTFSTASCVLLHCQSAVVQNQMFQEYPTLDCDIICKTLSPRIQLIILYLKSPIEISYCNTLG